MFSQTKLFLFFEKVSTSSIALTGNEFLFLLYSGKHFCDELVNFLQSILFFLCVQMFFPIASRELYIRNVTGDQLN